MPQAVDIICFCLKLSCSILIETHLTVAENKTNNRLEAYNNDYHHLSLGYLPPHKFELLEMERIDGTGQVRTAKQLEQIEATEYIKPHRLGVVSL